MDALDIQESQGSGIYESYLESSSAPLTCFIFALPLLLVYHIGLWYLNTFDGLRWANAVDIAIAEGLGYLGMAGPLLSFIMVVIVFLAMHAMSGRSWRWPQASTWFLMVLESLVLALPVFMLSRLVVKLADYLPLSMLDDAGEFGDGLSWRANLILSCGAGVYEEFFFRIIIMGMMVFLIDKLLGIRSGWKYALAATGQAVLFAASHHLPGGPEEILGLAAAREAAPVFLFRTLAGMYFAFLYVERGFGIAAGSHAAYDLMVVLLDVFVPLEAA
ncbi:MAG: CPBP family intramembrane metalloprotease [Planctomycetes bacterium]|nr:CPBP family intramembrane metalloprotease [Planctomycetota bacterium]